MKTTKQNPQWWQLYLTFPLLIVLFMADSRLKISSRGHQVVQIGIVIFVYWLIHRWLKTNGRALSGLELLDHNPTFRVIRMPVHSFSWKDEQPLVQLPDSEIKGMLDDTYDLDYIDAKALPVNEASKQ